ncbi:Pr6Pr family membrane protein [Jatrophihabitans sp.]|uniref:Pr6Pr family membrane protein n=1 Tax=Jatrophihabitans sp. TaxID=1932789 RepID=UPI0030C6C84D|nr:hypothetical protein [Jatrophihabitans sp.]
MIARVCHGAIALVVVAALVLQVKIAHDASAVPAGHAVGTLAGTSFAGRLVRVFSFFTVQSNILSAVVSAQLARNPARDGAVWRVVRLAALFGITVTGIVYSTVLARVHEPKGWEQTSSNLAVHYVVPLAMVLVWLLFGPRPRISRDVVLWSLAWPVAWLAYTLIRGEITHWYPYPFVDAATHGYGRVLVNSVAVTAVFAVVALLFAWGDRRLRRDP